MIKPNELRNMTIDEVRMKKEALKKELYDLRSEARSGRIEKPHKIRMARRDIARCETIMRELSRGKAPAPSAEPTPRRTPASKPGLARGNKDK